MRSKAATSSAVMTSLPGFWDPSEWASDIEGLEHDANNLAK
jgi:hypothetical protein